MYFSSWIEFLNMEGHGLYVWSSYAVALAIIVYNIAAPVRHKKRIKMQVQRQDRLESARKKQSGIHSDPVLQSVVGGGK
ncbi:heme exporter protein CcmD [Endozoicomonas sp. (ex Bugula neritina AB1)]|nr:heme exporter protein CcmD [Endozoicomonas sp. (ex Bugula neritina AB1)]